MTALNDFSVILSDAMQDQKLSTMENIATLQAGPKITFRALNDFGVILSDAMQQKHSAKHCSTQSAWRILALFLLNNSHCMHKCQWFTMRKHNSNLSVGHAGCSQPAGFQPPTLLA